MENQNKEEMNIDQIFEDAMNDSSLLSTINIDNLLNTLENTKNDYLDNKTMADISKEVYENVSECDIHDDGIESLCKKLIGYRYVDEIYELHKGKMVRWVRDGTSKLTNGGIVTDIKFLPNGVHVQCMNSMKRFIQYKFDDCKTFQKMNTEEQLILLAYDHLS